MRCRLQCLHLTRSLWRFLSDFRNLGQPRKVAWNGVAVIQVGSEIRQEIVDELGEAGVEAGLYGKNGIRMNIKISDIETHRNLISSVLAKADAFSRG